MIYQAMNKTAVPIMEVFCRVRELDALYLATSMNAVVAWMTIANQLNNFYEHKCNVLKVFSNIF